jgi:hypothetical protein
MPSVVMLSVIMLNVTYKPYMLSVVMLVVVAPYPKLLAEPSNIVINLKTCQNASFFNRLDYNETSFITSTSGRLFGLETDSFHWREVPYLGIEFKRLSASRNSLWALGGDHQVAVL